MFWHAVINSCNKTDGVEFNDRFGFPSSDMTFEIFRVLIAPNYHLTNKRYRNSMYYFSDSNKGAIIAFGHGLKPIGFELNVALHSSIPLLILATR